jgi:hypothetical protein
MINPGTRLAERVRLRKLEEQPQQAQQPVKQAQEQPVEPESGGFFADVAEGIIEAPGQALGGFLDATKELSQIMETIVPLGTTSGEEVTEESFLAVEKGDSVTGGLVRGVAQFLTGFIPAMKGLKGLGAAGGLKTAAGAGAIADATVFDPFEERLSNLIQEYPALQNPLTDYLEAHPDDSEAEGRFKNALEGLGVGGLIDTFAKGIKVMREGRKANVEAKVQRQKDAKLQRQVDEEVDAELKGEPTTEQRVSSALGDGDDAVVPKTISKKTANKFINDPVTDTDTAININMSRIDSEDDVKDVIRQTSELFSDTIEKSRRGKISLDETEKLADNLGMSVSDLMARNKGEAFNAENAVAARKILVASGEKVVELSKRVASIEGTDADKFALMKAITVQKAIQEQVSGLTAEAGRALGSFRINAKSSKAQLEQIQNVLDVGGKNINDLADALSMADNPAAVNKIIDDSFQATKSDIFQEFWLNSILSSMGTHVVNVVGNGMTIFWNVGNRFISPAIGKAFGDQETTVAEAVQSLYGAVHGAKDGMKLAWEAIKSSDVTDDVTTIERGHKRIKAITAEQLNVRGPFARSVDYAGSAIRTPSRLLTAGDKFFQSINARMELHALGYRQAVDEGLKGDAAGKRMMEIVNNPSEELLKQSQEFARVQTFTNDLGKVGSSIQNLANSHPVMKVLLPFVRTPLNIMKYVGKGTPLAPISKQFRADIQAGGARRDRALAQMGTGTSIMMIAASMAAEGQISGGGSSNFNVSRVKRLTGWQPYSVKIGDAWYSYNRLDPIGSTIGLAADISEIIGSNDEADAMDMASAAAVAVAKNVAGKTYLSGIMNFFTAFERAKADPSKDSVSVQKYLQSVAVGFMPFSSLVASVERQVDPTLRTAEGIVDKIKSRTPGFSADLPATLNIFGDPVVLEGGIGPDMMSPVYVSTDKKDVVADEMVKVGVGITMPPKAIFDVKLTPEEYHDYVELAGKGVKIRNKTYKQFMASEMKKNSYKRSSVEMKRLKIKSWTQGFRERAKGEMMKQNADLRLRIKQAKAEKRQALRPANQE